VEDSYAPKIDGFLPGDTCTFSIQMNSPILNEVYVSAIQNLCEAVNIPFNNKLDSHRDTMCKTFLILT
jgi:hypothetical protein